MNYKKLYLKIIRNAQNKIFPKIFIDGQEKKNYIENHHIFPISIFGKNKLKVNLTPKEHLVCHHLLWKYYKNKYGEQNFKTKKMLTAYWQMSNSKRYGKLTARQYQKVREEYSKEQSKNILDNRTKYEKFFWSVKLSGDNHRKGIHHSNETKNNISMSQPTRKEIKAINIETKEIKYFDSISEAAKASFNRRHIQACLKKERKKHKGFLWQYLDKDKEENNTI